MPTIADSIQHLQKFFTSYSPGEADGKKPERLKVASDPLLEFECLFLEGADTFGGFCKVLGLCIVTLGIGTIAALCVSRMSEKLEESEDIATQIAQMRINDSNESTELNWFYSLSLTEVAMIKDVMLKLSHQETMHVIDKLAENNGDIRLLSWFQTNDPVPVRTLAVNNSGIYMQEKNGQPYTLLTLEQYKESDCFRAFQFHAKKTPSVIKHVLKPLTKSEIISGISAGLSGDARTVFGPLLRHERIGLIDNASPIASGGLDGSIARQVLLGIQAGIIETDNEGQQCLARLMNAEAYTLKQIWQPANIQPEFKAFQQDPEIQQTVKNLSEHLKYKNGDTPLIIMGHVMRGKCTSYTRYERHIREKMHEHGVRFITGKHDSLFEKMDDHIESGCYALDDGNPEQWKDHQDKILTNAYFDEAQNTLYVNHGVARDEDGNIITAFGRYEVPETGLDLTDFLAWMNKSERRPLPFALAPNEEKSDLKDRHFAMWRFKLKDDLIRQFAKDSTIRIVYVQDEMIENTSSDVLIGINSMKHGDNPTVAGFHIGSIVNKDSVNFARQQSLFHHKVAFNAHPDYDSI